MFYKARIVFLVKVLSDEKKENCAILLSVNDFDLLTQEAGGSTNAEFLTKLNKPISQETELLKL